MNKEGYGPISWDECYRRGVDKEFWTKLITNLEGRKASLDLVIRLLKHDSTLSLDETLEATKIVRDLESMGYFEQFKRKVVVEEDGIVTTDVASVTTSA